MTEQDTVGEQATAEDSARGTGAEQDIVDVLLEDHAEFRQLFEELERADADSLDDLFRYTVARLASHEAAEEAIVHRSLRDDVPDGKQIAVEVLSEEENAEELLAEMQDMELDSAEFREALSRLKTEVLGHAEHEENEEFPRLREHVNADDRRKMAERFRKVRDHGPTRPHPGTPQTPEVRATLGPVAGAFDRARDTAREALDD